MALPSLTLNHTNRPLDFFVMKAEGDRLEMNQPYQRGLVWGTERKQNLIRSILMGLPIGAVILNNRLMAEFEDGTTDYAVIDGKQRITTLIEFMADEFTVPADWFPTERVERSEDGMVAFSGLSLPGQRKFENTIIACCEAQVRTEGEEKDIFDLINFGGVAQGDSDL